MNDIIFHFSCFLILLIEGLVPVKSHKLQATILKDIIENETMDATAKYKKLFLADLFYDKLSWFRYLLIIICFPFIKILKILTGKSKFDAENEFDKKFNVNIFIILLMRFPLLSVLFIPSILITLPFIALGYFFTKGRLLH